MSLDSPAPSAIPIALLGADALLAARPASPVQVLHACVAAGFAAAYPVTWGDELVAGVCLSRLAEERPRRAILCACPYALRGVVQDASGAQSIAVTSPPVAAARMVRRAYHGQTIRITYVGGCPSGADADLDAHVSPSAFLATLEERGIALREQPDAFEGVLPPDRRRFLSMPGGCPEPAQLAGIGYTLADESLDARRQAPDDSTLVDLAPASGCVCSGAPQGRDAVVELEPPRAAHPIVDRQIDVDLSPGPLIAVVVARGAASHVTPRVDVIAEPNVSSIQDPPATQRAFTPERISLRGGPVRELRRPVFPQSESVYEDLPPRRRFTLTALVLAAALGVALPLAALGGWTLLRGTPDAPSRPDVAFDSGALDTLPPAASVVQPGTQTADSTATTLDSSRTADSSTVTPAPVGAPVPEVQREDSAAATERASQSRVKDRESESRVTKRRGPTSDSGTGGSSRVDAKASAGSAPRTTVTGGMDSSRGTKQTSPSELDSLVKEIARRRTRIDSLNRVMDSLNRPRKRPSGFR